MYGISTYTFDEFLWKACRYIYHTLSVWVYHIYIYGIYIYLYAIRHKYSSGRFQGSRLLGFSGLQRFPGPNSSRDLPKEDGPNQSKMKVSKVKS